LAVNVRVVDDDVVVLSGFGRLMNDPRHFDAGRDVHELVTRGYRKYVIELRGVAALGPSGIGLLVTLTRLIRQHDGDAVLAGVADPMGRRLDDLQLDAYWEVFERVEDAVNAFKPPA
jgi:anti-sigma B factor antagonist